MHLSTEYTELAPGEGGESILLRPSSLLLCFFQDLTYYRRLIRWLICTVTLKLNPTRINLELMQLYIDIPNTG